MGSKRERFEPILMLLFVIGSKQRVGGKDFFGASLSYENRETPIFVGFECRSQLGDLVLAPAFVERLRGLRNALTADKLSAVLSFMGAEGKLQQKRVVTAVGIGHHFMKRGRSALDVKRPHHH